MLFADSFSPDDYRPAVAIESDPERACEAFRRHEPVLIHDFDDRENEVDLVFPAAAVTPDDIAQMRNDAGGLICVALSNDVAEAFDLPFLADEFSHPTSETSDLEYDKRSSFSLTVNHRNTYTGITDIDRALTISKLGEAAADPEGTNFAAEFRSPGHVHLLKAAPGLLADRKGHTELGLALAAKSDCIPAVVVCEMLDDKTGRELSKRDALRYAQRNDHSYVTGSDLFDFLDDR